MMIALDKGRILIKDEDTVQRAIITSWGKMRRDRRTKLLVGDCDLELMNKLAEIINLPPKIEKLRQKLNTIQNRVDEERIKENPEALYPYPVTKKLYQHQVRAANMALLTFEMAASGAEELTKKFEDGYQGKIPRPYEHGHGELYLCPNCSYLLLNSASRNNWCPNCKTRINWKKVDELGGEEKCGR